MITAAHARLRIEPAARWVEPAVALRALAGPGATLLEAGAGGRWSYLVPRPSEVLDGPAGRDLATAARALLARVADERPADAPPFTGGLVGSLGYDLARGLERLPVHARDDLGLPAVRLHLAESVIAFDHAHGEVLVCARDEAELRALGAALAGVREAELPPPPGARLAGMPFATYRPLCEQVLSHIARGDVYEVNLTHRLEAPCTSAIDLYARLRATAPVPYGLYLDAGSFAIAGASPECFLRVDPEGFAETRPIKGTRPRSDDVDEDAALADELWRSPKDRAENVMIVDLARNDLSRVCVPGTVAVPALFAIESHPTVHQMVSTVTGRLAPGADALDLVLAAFPPGSMTGCPKVRAMELIEELEPVRRGPYAGAFGWLGPDGACDLAVVIRTAVVTGGRAYVHVGGAVVADSTAAGEYEESLVKARTVQRALSG